VAKAKQHFGNAVLAVKTTGETPVPQLWFFS
jgi:hypothetical protein